MQVSPEISELLQKIAQALEQHNKIEMARNDALNNISRAIFALAAVQDGQGLP